MKSQIGKWSIGLWLCALAMPAAAQFEEDDEFAGENFEEDEPATEEGTDFDGPPEPDADGPIADGSDGGGSLWLSAGLKIGGGGNLLLSPDSPPIGAQPFDDGVGGYAFTFGPYVEARILDGVLGFQTGLIFDFATNLSELTLNGVDINIGWSATDLRIPFLFQLGTPGQGTRLYVTTGPEVAVGLSAEESVEVDGGLQPIGAVTVESTTHVNWVAGFGLASNVSVLRLSFDLLFAYNLGVPASYAERVDVGVLSWSTDAQTNMDLRLLIGVGYDFGAVVD